MLKELVQYLEDRKVNIIENGFLKYTDKPMYLMQDPYTPALKTNTLDSIVGYIKNNVDGGSLRYIVHVLSHNKVQLLSEVTSDGQRWIRVEANAITPTIEFNRFMDLENFNITLQSMFVNDENRNKLLSVIGNISNGSVTAFNDDGFTQAVNVTAGIKRIGQEQVPNPIILTPFRTFPEIEQPSSMFTLRMRSSKNDEMPYAALFEADGAAWKITAIRSISDYLKSKLEDVENIVILS